MPYRISIDTGGTFTDAVIADSSGTFTIGKALTTPERIFAGMRDAIVAAARERDLTLDELLDDTGILIYGTTRATNAIVEGRVAKTAFLVTHGFPNVLLFREGGRANAFDWTQDFPIRTCRSTTRSKSSSKSTPRAASTIRSTAPRHRTSSIR